MITLRLNPYTDAEKKALDAALQSAMNKFIDIYCGPTPCRECNYRHVCYDLDRARRYVNKIVGGDGQ